MATRKESSHLTLADRNVIEASIRKGATQTAIAKCVGKNKACIGKEIAKHREKRPGRYPIECARFPKCVDRTACLGRNCPNIVLFVCRRRDHSPGACNGCEKYRSCHYFKYYYDANKADNEYREDLVGTREGINMTVSELADIGNKIKPLIDNGLSPYAALKACPDIAISTKTLYNYIEDGVFKDIGINISNIDLRRKVSRKPRKPKEITYKKRNERAFLIGREYKDYEAYLEEHPDAHVVQMDTVYNDVTNGPFIQTFKFIDDCFLFAIFHRSKTSEEMANGVDMLEQILGEELFEQEVQVILTDRGSEFYDVQAIENRKNGYRRTRLFFCDPMCSNQKGSLENNHEELRYILPKEKDLYALGLNSQDDMNLVISHVNSFRKSKLKGKSPIELMRFFKPDLWSAFMHTGISEIDQNQIVLKPSLLKLSVKDS